MDDRRFDAWTRSLATGLSRRNVLKGLFGGAVLGGAAATKVQTALAQPAPCGPTAPCPEGSFCCNGFCCPNANNCCGEETCCPPGQCNQTEGVCCESFEFACGTGDSTCCNTAEEKCCGGVCISANLCCPQFEPEDCPAGFFCCEDFACHECCVAEDCEPPDACTPAGCTGGFCDTGSICGDPSVCCPDGECRECCEECCSNEDCNTLETCEICVQGSCERACSVDQECCISGPVNDVTIECVDECCDDSDCGECELCVEGGACRRACPLDEVCCISGPPNDITIECVEECCDDDDCADCHVCNVDGVCEPESILCEQGLLACCVQDELMCVECCEHSDCGECEFCAHNSCVEDPECCPHFGDPCGLIINGTVTIADGSDRLDCCPGLVCCEFKEGVFCAECCSDHDCGKDECCCHDGTCSHKCCDRKCVHDKDCPHGTCCCDDGSCSDKCCKRPPDKPTPTTAPPVGGPMVGKLPSTGAGDDDDGLGIIGTAALGAAAAYLAGKALRETETPVPETPSAEE